MTNTILVTGSLGLVGRHLCSLLRSRGYSVREFDIRGTGGRYGDVTNAAELDAAIRGSDGVVHLAAVSRVVWGQRDPDLCWRTNVGGLRSLLEIALQQTTKPWILFSSSREVYGQASSLPVSEDAPLQPVNAYAESKVEGERLISAARSAGLQAAVVRLSNVYGCTKDHADRVVPAFARSAALGNVMHVEGTSHTFDFTHVDDVVRGVNLLIDRLQSGVQTLPTLHLLTGHPTTLGQLAALCHELGNRASQIEEAPPRTYDVAHFYGDPLQASKILGWKPEISLRTGVQRLIEDFKQEYAQQSATEVAV